MKFILIKFLTIKSRWRLELATFDGFGEFGKDFGNIMKDLTRSNSAPHFFRYAI